MKKQRKWWIPGTAVLCVAVGVGASLFLRYRGKSPEELLISYMDCISAGKYEKMQRLRETSLLKILPDATRQSM